MQSSDIFRQAFHRSLRCARGTPKKLIDSVARVCADGEMYYICARDVTHLFDLLFARALAGCWTGRPAKSFFCARASAVDKSKRPVGRRSSSSFSFSLFLRVNKFLERFHPYLLPPINTWTAAAWLFLSKTHKALSLSALPAPLFFLSPTLLTQNACDCIDQTCYFSRHAPWWRSVRIDYTTTAAKIFNIFKCIDCFKTRRCISIRKLICEEIASFLLKYLRVRKRSKKFVISVGRLWKFTL